MCGIVGRVGDLGDVAGVREVARRQLAMLRHRGPDDQGIVAEPGFVLGHVRLAIIDPAHTRDALIRALEAASLNPVIPEFKTGVLQT